MGEEISAEPLTWLAKHRTSCTSNCICHKIAGDITLSDNPGAAIQKWRSIYKVSQRALADKMGVMSSVVSDYESGRRKSPGIAMIQKIVGALLNIDAENGSAVSHQFNSIYPEENLSDAIIDMRETKDAVALGTLLPIVNGTLIADKEDESKSINGYIIIDSIRAIVEISPNEFVKLSNLANDRAVVFTGVASGKSALVAMKVANIRPAAVIFHGPKELDKLAERIARVEKIPIIISNMQSVDELVSALKSMA